jgi:hypothetical protein
MADPTSQQNSENSVLKGREKLGRTDEVKLRYFRTVAGYSLSIKCFRKVIPCDIVSLNDLSSCTTAPHSAQYHQSHYLSVPIDRNCIIHSSATCNPNVIEFWLKHFRILLTSRFTGIWMFHFSPSTNRWLLLKDGARNRQFGRQCCRPRTDQVATKKLSNWKSTGQLRLPV